MAIKGVNDLVEAAKSRIENLDVDDVVAELDAGATIVDIRDIRERIQLGAIPGSIHAPRGMLEFWAAPDSEYYRDMWVEDGRYVLYCAKGSRSGRSAARRPSACTERTWCACRRWRWRWTRTTS